MSRRPRSAPRTAARSQPTRAPVAIMARNSEPYSASRYSTTACRRAQKATCSGETSTPHSRHCPARAA
eukprot:7384543-Alexandrium_andersonii.AAC.1